MPAVTWLIGEDVNIVFKDFHTVFGVFYYDGTVLVADDEVEFGDGKLVVDRLSYNRRVFKSFFCFVDGGEIHGNPEREFVSSDVGFVIDGVFFVISITGEVEPSNGEAGFAHTVKIERSIFDDDGHTDNGAVLRCHFA